MKRGTALGLGIVGITGVTLAATQALVAYQSVIGLGGFIAQTILSSLVPPGASFTLTGIAIRVLPAAAGIVGSAGWLAYAGRKGAS